MRTYFYERGHIHLSRPSKGPVKEKIFNLFTASHRTPTGKRNIYQSSRASSPGSGLPTPTTPAPTPPRPTASAPRACVARRGPRGHGSCTSDVVSGRPVLTPTRLALALALVRGVIHVEDVWPGHVAFLRLR